MTEHQTKMAVGLGTTTATNTKHGDSKAPKATKLAAAKVFEWFPHGGPRGATHTQCALKSNAQIAEAAGVHANTIKQAKTVQREAEKPQSQHGCNPITPISTVGLLQNPTEPDNGKRVRDRLAHLERTA